MKKALFTLVLLSSLSAFANEQTVRLTNTNIASVEVQTATPPDEASCGLYTKQYAKTIVKLKNQSELIFTSSGMDAYCSDGAKAANSAARKLANIITSIQNEDIEAFRIGDNVVCQKDIGYAIWNEMTKGASEFSKKQVTVKCP